jgi:hypothetical protein
MDEIKQKVAEKMRNRAMSWHQKRGDSSSDAPVIGVVNVSEADSVIAELGFVRELIKIVEGSNIERKSIILNALTNQEQKLASGYSAEKLPELTRNISRKREIGGLVIGLAKRYKIGKQNLAYWWGLESA